MRRGLFLGISPVLLIGIMWRESPRVVLFERGVTTISPSGPRGGELRIPWQKPYSDLEGHYVLLCGVAENCARRSPKVSPWQRLNLYGGSQQIFFCWFFLLARVCHLEGVHYDVVPICKCLAWVRSLYTSLVLLEVIEGSITFMVQKFAFAVEVV